MDDWYSRMQQFPLTPSLCALRIYIIKWFPNNQFPSFTYLRCTGAHVITLLN